MRCFNASEAALQPSRRWRPRPRLLPKFVFSRSRFRLEFSPRCLSPCVSKLPVPLIVKRVTRTKSTTLCEGLYSYTDATAEAFEALSVVAVCAVWWSVVNTVKATQGNACVL